MQKHHETEIVRRIEKLLHLGAVSVEDWETVLWYGAESAYQRMYEDVFKRFRDEFSKLYGDCEGAKIQVLRQRGVTLFLNDEELCQLESLMEM